MTSKADLPTLGAFLRDLGIDLFERGTTAWERSKDWEEGPKPAPGEGTDEVCCCAHLASSHYQDTGPCMFTLPPEDSADGEVWACSCQRWEPSAGDPAGEDRRDEAKAAAMAALEHVAFSRAVAAHEQTGLELRRRFDRLCPPDPAKAKVNKRTGEHDPETAAEVALAGYCSNCWRNDEQMVPITKDRRTGKPIFRDFCEWCGRSKAEYGILPDLLLLRLRHEGRRITQKDWDQALARAKANAPKKTGKKGKKRGRMAA